MTDDVDFRINCKGREFYIHSDARDLGSSISAVRVEDRGESWCRDKRARVSVNRVGRFVGRGCVSGLPGFWGSGI